MSITYDQYTVAYDEVFLNDVVAGLSGKPKTLPCKYFYDARGSELFDRICELEEYYPTRTERSIMERYADEMVAALGDDVVLLEPGSGSSTKTLALLDRMPNLAAYVPIDISETYLHGVAERLRLLYPGLAIHPLAVDYTRPFELPAEARGHTRHACFFPGSTIGNFVPTAAEHFLRVLAGVLPREGTLLIGVDLRKDQRILEAAYNDAEGVTAAFNLNILHRINAELGGTFPHENFFHRAHFDENESRIEMHLYARHACKVRVGGRHIFQFDAGESIHTENSYKYSPDSFARLARTAGFEVGRVWTDPDDLFSVQLLVRRDDV